MDTTNPKGPQMFIASTTTVAEKKGTTRIQQGIGVGVWCIGFIVLIVSSVFVHAHPGPWAFDLTTTRSVQSLHPWGWIVAFLTFINVFNNGIQAAVELALWFVILLLFRQYRYAIFIGLGSATFDGLNGLLGTIVARPRPSPHLIQVTMAEPTSSFPSGHVEHCLVYYGLLLYISFTPALRQWKYHWLLLPFQIFAALTILCVGFARIEAGSHWATDVFAGYLSGALLLTIMLILYRWAVVKFPHRDHGKKKRK